GAVAAGCAGRVDTTDASSQASPKTSVQLSVVTPQRKSVVRMVEQPGGIQAYEQTDLYARVPGYVGKVRVDIGQKITSGQVLAELDVPELQEETRQKQAMVRQSAAEVEQAEKSLAAAVANVAVMNAGVVEAKAFYDRWESESKRMAGLVRGGVVDTQA